MTKRIFSIWLAVFMLLAVMPLSFAEVSAAAYGDVNGDGKINNRDLGVLQQYLNDYDVDVDDTAADVNDDGRVNNRDLGLIQQYLNDWDVTLGPAGGTIRILAVGDAFAVDAMQNHLYEMFRSAGYRQIQLGILYTETATLDTYYSNLQSDAAVYEYRETTDGTWTTTDGYTTSRALERAEWNVVVLQQDGAEAGNPDSYGKLTKLSAAVQNRCANAEIYWHMTWAFQQSSQHSGFAQYHYNQLVMYRAIVDTALSKVMRDFNIWGLLPVGTAIQNLRTSTLQDNLTVDGQTLVDTYGDYTAALTWFCRLTQESASTMTYRPAGIADHFEEIAEAVDNAIAIPNEITPAAGGDGDYKTISILAVGNSFAIDAMYNHLYPMLDTAGYDEIRLGILYVGGCSVDMHYNYIRNDTASYEYLENINGKWTNTKEYKASDAFALTDWDFVTVQQVSGSSGRPDTYGNLDALLELIKPQIGDAQLYWQMTWAYQQDSDHYDFRYYNKDQMTMYNAIVSTVQEQIVGHPLIDGVIPSGTAIQNLRTSSLGDTVTADGYHLSDSYGDFTAALTWFCTLTGEPPYKMLHCPNGVVDHYLEIVNAVSAAVANPFAITPAA